MFLHSWIPSPTIVSLGAFELRWYGLLLALGAAAGLVVLRALGRKRGFLDTDLMDLFIWLTMAGFIGGRLYHVLNEFSYYLKHPTQIWMVWEGGLGIHGAILAGLITLIVFAQRKKLSPWKLLDCLAPALVLGQVIGRWGNYFNQELFGRPTDRPWGIPIEAVHRPLGHLNAPYFHPTFLYESLGNLAILGFLLWLGKRQRLPTGVIALTYFILYALLRIGMETLRIDQTPIIAGVRLPILFSGVMILTAITLLVYRFRHGSKTS